MVFTCYFFLQWDVLSSGSTVHEIAHISNGIHPGNFITIVQVFTISFKFMLQFYVYITKVYMA